MNWNCDIKINKTINEAKRHMVNHIEMLHIQTLSKINFGKKRDTDKLLIQEMIELFLRKRGYTMNYVSGEPVLVKNFTCVLVFEKYVEIWHNTSKRNKSVFIQDSLLTGLPITLDYMERI